MKISATPLSVAREMKAAQLDQIKYFELLASAGAEATDIVDPDPYSWFWKDYKKDIAALPGLLKANGLEIASYATGNNFTLRDPEQFSRQIGHVKDAVRKTAELEVKILRIFGGYHKDINPEFDMDYAEGLKQIVRAIEEILPCAEKNGVVLALENHGRLPGLAAELRYIMEYFNSPALGICFDIANFTAHNMNEHEDAVAAYTMLKKYIKHVHCKDWQTAPAGSARPTVAAVCGKGCGIVPLRRLAYMMEEDRFDGYWALEYEAGGIEGFTESIRYMKSLKEAAALLYPEVKK